MNYRDVLKPVFDRHKIPLRLRPSLIRYLTVFDEMAENLKPHFHTSQVQRCIPDCLKAINTAFIKELSRGPESPHAVARTAG